ncbi:MAG: outer membrane lipoprotein chaperone LolA [Nitrospinota bacterium]|nr:outer membrane lipoprotein chaperone LolA [Nitrospinota bacterium]
MPRLTLFLLLLFTPLPTVAEENQTTLEAIQKRYDFVETFKAKFTQKAYVKIMGQSQESTGDVYIKKPGMMKWTYNNPEPQVLISNNKTLWLYLPEDRQVTKARIRDIYTNNTPALFLSGKGKLADSFEVTEVTREPNKITVVLVPKEKEKGLERLVLFAENKNYQIIGSKVYDELGNQTEILFSQIEVNPEFSDDLFEFQVPAGVDLLDATKNP